MSKLPENLSNIDTGWKTEPDWKGDTWKFRELSGEHLGARIEELDPGAVSAEHHYHTTEEEHVMVLSGRATLHLGDETFPLAEGDHIWFRAGDAVPHHLRNNSDSPCRFLVFGERKADDVVFYPEHQVMALKLPERGLYTYRPVKDES